MFKHTRVGLIRVGLVHEGGYWISCKRPEGRRDEEEEKARGTHSKKCGAESRNQGSDVMSSQNVGEDIYNDCELK